MNKAILWENTCLDIKENSVLFNLLFKSDIFERKLVKLLDYEMISIFLEHPGF